jgi:hypothetical protein
MTMTGLSSVQVERLSDLKDEVDGGLESLLEDAESAGGGQVVAMARHVLMSVESAFVRCCSCSPTMLLAGPIATT